jgi:hypothetical protein
MINALEVSDGASWQLTLSAISIDEFKLTHRV